jgi:hypothetical protein
MREGVKHQRHIRLVSSLLELLDDVLKLVQHVVQRNHPVITDTGSKGSSYDAPSSIIDSMEPVDV